MEIVDYSKEYNVCPDRPHSAIFPKNIFAVVSGATGCGKSNLVVNFLKQAKILNYDHVYIYSSTLHQPAYESLKRYFADLEKLIFDSTNHVIKIAQFYDADSEIKNPSELDKNKSHIMIFDDVMNHDQRVIKTTFVAADTTASVFSICVNLSIKLRNIVLEKTQMYSYYSGKMTKL